MFDALGENNTATRKRSLPLLTGFQAPRKIGDGRKTRRAEEEK